MITVQECTECMHSKVCKYQDDFEEEIQLLLTIQNKFINSDVTTKCHHYAKKNTSQIRFVRGDV